MITNKIMKEQIGQNTVNHKDKGIDIYRKS